MHSTKPKPKQKSRQKVKLKRLLKYSRKLKQKAMHSKKRMDFYCWMVKPRHLHLTRQMDSSQLTDWRIGSQKVKQTMKPKCLHLWMPKHWLKAMHSTKLKAKHLDFDLSLDLLRHLHLATLKRLLKSKPKEKHLTRH